MDAINSFVGWLFGDKTGVLFLVLGGILLFLVISFVLERKTKKMYSTIKRLRMTGISLEKTKKAGLTLRQTTNRQQKAPVKGLF